MRTLLRSGLACLVAGILTAVTLRAADSPPAAPRRGYTFDAKRYQQADLAKPGEAERVWDSVHALSALQGLANRDAARLYLFFCAEFGVETDRFWWQWLREQDGWLKNTEVRELESLEAVLAAFRDQVQGLAVYDPLVPATANLASTAAGVDRLLPVRYDAAPGSLYQRLRQTSGLEVKLWLVNPDGTSRFTGKGTIPDLNRPSTGSAKNDAYLWALERFVKAGACQPGYGAYYLDAFWLKLPRQAGLDLHTLSNHDYFIARKSFFFDLSPWADETPNDDPTQRLGLDHETFLTVLRRLYDHAGGGIVKIGGFTPWPYKYTDHGGVGGKHGGVPTEWEHARLISQYNGYMEADAAGLSAMANASFFQHYQLKARYEQPNPKPSRAQWQARGFLTDKGPVSPRLYVGFYVGDYDAPSWLYKAVAAFAKDPARGQVPLGWAFNPNLADRAAPALAYAYRHATTNDFFITGDSGAGYLNARGLTIRPDSKLPSGLEAWRQHNLRYCRQWDMTIAGFILDGAAGASTELEYRAYRDFAPDGFGTHYDEAPTLHAGVPACRETDLPDAPAEAAKVLLRRASGRSKDQPAFFWARTILKSPGWHAEVVRRVHAEAGPDQVAFVDPYTFFGLIRQHLGGKP